MNEWRPCTAACMAYEEANNQPRCKILVVLEKLPASLRRTPERPTAPPPSVRNT